MTRVSRSPRASSIFLRHSHPLGQQLPDKTYQRCCRYALLPFMYGFLVVKGGCNGYGSTTNREQVLFKNSEGRPKGKSRLWHLLPGLNNVPTPPQHSRPPLCTC